MTLPRAPSGANPEPLSGPDRVTISLSIRRWGWAGAWVIVSFLSLLGAWSSLAPLDRAAIAPGVVKVAGERKAIQHLEGGIVSDLRISDGDRVEAGQVLLRLDDSQALARLDLIEGRRVARLAQAARLRAERDGLDPIAFPAELLGASAHPSAPAAVAGQADILRARRMAVEGKRAILEQRILQTEEEIRGLEALIAAQETLNQLIESEADDLEGLFGQGYTTKERLLGLRRRQAEVAGDRAANVASLARAWRSIAEIEQQILDLSTSILNEVVSELSLVEADLFDLAQQHHAADDLLRRLEIRAPVSGAVIGQQIHTPGGVVRPGEVLLYLVPLDDQLVIEAHVRPEDIDSVAPGQSANIRFSAFNFFEVSPLLGVVENVSADRLLDQRTGSAHFSATIFIPDDELKKLSGRSLFPGLTAEVMIQTGTRTLFSYLAEPLARNFYKAFRE